MFKALAEFVMRGRVQAVAVALVGSLSMFPVISQAVLGLVTLRKGWQEGMLVTLWVSLPVLVGAWTGMLPAYAAFITLALFSISYLVCCILRLTVSWSVAFAANVGFVVLLALGLAISTDVAGNVSELFKSLVVVESEAELPSEVQALISGWTTINASGLIAYLIGINVVAGILLARWWQALLYNPGGFREEFHQLRLPKIVALVCVGLVFYCVSMGGEYLYWRLVFSLPLLFTGLGLMHWVVAKYRLGLPALILLYIVLPVVDAAALLLMMLALLDAGLDLRNKLETGRSS